MSRVRHAPASSPDAVVLVASWIIGAALLAYATYGGLSVWSRPATSPLVPLALGASVAAFAGGAFTVARRPGPAAWVVSALVALSTVVALTLVLIKGH